MKRGYARISTPRQKSLSWQVEMLREAGCKVIYIDVISGYVNKGQGLKNLMNDIMDNDHVMVCYDDRLTRDAKQFFELMADFYRCKVKFYSLSGF